MRGEEGLLHQSHHTGTATKAEMVVAAVSQRAD
jgi:hypothetical protein